MAGAATGGVSANPQTPRSQLPSGLTGPQFPAMMMGSPTPQATSATMQSPVMNMQGGAVGGGSPNAGMEAQIAAGPSAFGGSSTAPMQTTGVGGMPVDPMQQASMAQQGAFAGTVGAGLTDIGTIAGSDIGQYQNPFTQQVIDANTADIMRGAQMGLDTLGAQAQAARAFGGSRHGVAMSELGRGVAEQIGQQSSQLRQAGFQNAQQMAQADIQNRLSQANLGLGASAQLGNLGQQSFGYGTAIQDQIAQQGAQQQAMQQALIDAAKAQYAGYTGAPAAGLGYVSQALGATNIPVTTTESRQPGLFDYLTLAATAAR